MENFRKRHQAFLKSAEAETTYTQVQEQASSEESGNFLYLDDFFYWLGCKFVTCDKPKHKDPAHSHNDQPHPQASVPA